jgi:hypothetical protein
MFHAFSLPVPFFAKMNSFAKVFAKTFVIFVTFRKFFAKSEKMSRNFRENTIKKISVSTLLATVTFENLII